MLQYEEFGNTYCHFAAYSNYEALLRINIVVYSI